MEIKRVISIILLFTSLWIVISIPASALSLREIFGLDDDDSVESTHTEKQQESTLTVEKKSDSTKKDNGDGKSENVAEKLSFDEVQKVMLVIDESQRKALLADEEAFLKFIQQEAANKSVLAAARVNKVDTNEKTVFLTRRGAENIIRELYLNQLITSKIPPDFPTDQQVKDYYEQNKEKFVLGERVHIWQIFLPITEEKNNQKDIELLKKKANSIINDINTKKIDFAVAAQLYSGHEGSLTTGGYMGLVKVSDLKPEIKEPLMKLDEGKISNPVKSDEGIHILKRGTIVPEQSVEFDQIKDQIHKLLTNQMQSQLRQAIYDQASKTYPVEISDNKIEEWRLKLRTDLNTSKLSTSTQ